MGYSDQRRGCNGLVWISWTSRLPFRYLLLLVLHFRPLTIMLIDLLACGTNRWGCLSPAGEAGRAPCGDSPTGCCHVAGHRGAHCLGSHVGRHDGYCYSDVRMTYLRRFYVTWGPRAHGTPS
jgi:hypothetical protein